MTKEKVREVESRQVEKVKLRLSCPKVLSLKMTKENLFAFHTTQPEDAQLPKLARGAIVGFTPAPSRDVVVLIRQLPAQTDKQN